MAAGTAAFAALALAGCGADPDPDYQGVCVDKRTQYRVSDVECDRDRHNGWYGFVFWPIGLLYPGIGSNFRSFPGGTGTVPDGHNGVKGGGNVSGGVATSESVKSAVKRGGFGTTSRGNTVGG